MKKLTHELGKELKDVFCLQTANSLHSTFQLDSLGKREKKKSGSFNWSA